MESLVASIGHHGYSILFFAVLAESLGFPVPAAVGLLIAGGASARHELSAGKALAYAITAMLLGDNFLFLLGRKTGWWLLSMLCRISLNPEGCIMKSADSFYRRGRVMLLFAKFLPGVNTMAPPLAGSMNLPQWQFFLLDSAGASLYILTYFGAGYLFSDALRLMLRGYSAVGSMFGWLIGVALALWIANRVRIWFQGRLKTPVPMLTPPEVAARENVIIFDVRSHGYYDEGTMRIKGSVRVEPSAVNEYIEQFPRDREIILYCT